MSKFKDQGIFYLLISVACLFKSAETTACIQEGKSLSGKGTCQIVLKDGYSVFIYENETISSPNISRIVLEATPENETSKDAFADVIIEEYKTNEGKYIEVETWKISSNETFKNSHFSQNERFKIIFNATGNWSNCKISLRYEEIKFEKFYLNSSDVVKNEITPWNTSNSFLFERHYRPNSEYTFRIEKNEKITSNSILITLNELEIDKEIGDYLLIGAGSEPFEGPPPECITEAGKKKYYVDDKTAYIVFVANATRKDYRGFNISWEYSGTEIKEPEVDEKEDVWKSVPICIYNISAANEEIKKPEGFKEFRENFAKVATQYSNASNTGSDNGNSFVSGLGIKASTVSVLISGKQFMDNESRMALYARVKITDDSIKGKAAFEYHDLAEIVSIYSDNASSGQIQDTFMFRKCNPRYVPEFWFYFGLILVIPVICFALLLFVWKQNPIAEHYEKKRKLKRASHHENSKYYADNCDFGAQSADGNPYTTLPKVQVTNEHGRKTTLNFSDTLLCDDNASDDELFNKMYSGQRRSDVLELQRMKMTNRMFLTNEGEDNAGFELNEDNISATEQRQHEDRAEHTYESLRSSASLCENTRL